MSTIPLNDALKAQKFDTVSLTTANVDELTTAPGTIYLGSVTLENNFPKYMTIGDPDGCFPVKVRAISPAGSAISLANAHDISSFLNSLLINQVDATTADANEVSKVNAYTAIDQMVLYVDAR